MSMCFRCRHLFASLYLIMLALFPSLKYHLCYVYGLCIAYSFLRCRRSSSSAGFMRSVWKPSVRGELITRSNIHNNNDDDDNNDTTTTTTTTTTTNNT